MPQTLLVSLHCFFRFFVAITYGKVSLYYIIWKSLQHREFLSYFMVAMQ